MISRRLLRIKALLVLYAYFKTTGSSINNSEKELFFSIQKTYDLYHYLFQLIIDIADFAEDKIEQARKKKLPTLEDLNPNLRFVQNKLIAQLRSNEQLIKYMGNSKNNAICTEDIVKDLYLKITASEKYADYMNKEDYTYSDDKKLVIDILSEDVLQCEPIQQTLEESSIYWNDDLDFTLGMVVKTLGKFKEMSAPSIRLMSMYKNEDDQQFVKQLFRKTILQKDENLEAIKKHTQNWELDRIAYMDILILQMAISELVEFPSIPIRVTFNEYIEMAKYYSTKNSSTFVNGVLDKITNDYKKSGKIIKTGRGLIDESQNQGQ